MKFHTSIFNTHYRNDIINGIKDTDCLLSIKLIQYHIDIIINNIQNEYNIDINDNEIIKLQGNENKIIDSICYTLNNKLGLQQFMTCEDFKDTLIENNYCNFIHNVSYDLSYLTLPINTNNDYYIYFEYIHIQVPNNNDDNDDNDNIDNNNNDNNNTKEKTKLNNIYIIAIKDYKLFLDNYFKIFDKIYYKELMVRFIPKLMYIMNDKDKDYIINNKLTISGYNSSLQKKEKIKALLNIL
jgi:hypothetical protein